jgi:hypothetical protein
MAIPFISVPIGSRGIRIGVAETPQIERERERGQDGAAGAGGAGLLGFMITIVLLAVVGYFALWLLVAFCLLKGLWRLARRELGVAVFWLALGLAIFAFNAHVALWLDNQLQSARQSVEQERVACTHEGGVWDAAAVHCWHRE